MVEIKFKARKNCDNFCRVSKNIEDSFFEISNLIVTKKIVYSNFMKSYLKLLSQKKLLNQNIIKKY